uniref:T-box domain-containing protein n=1 Tax=Esox lucius TaxID=8010 RepID=A0A6Q2X0S5_ESOLU
MEANIGWTFCESCLKPFNYVTRIMSSTPNSISRSGDEHKPTIVQTLATKNHLMLFSDSPWLKPTLLNYKSTKDRDSEGSFETVSEVRHNFHGFTEERYSSSSKPSLSQVHPEPATLLGNMFPHRSPHATTYPALSITTSGHYMAHHPVVTQGSYNSLLATTSPQGIPAPGYFYAQPYGHAHQGGTFHKSSPMHTGMVYGRAQVYLCNRALWLTFHRHQTEMIITKQGR